MSCPPNVDFEQGNYSNWSFYTGYCCPISTPTFTGPLSNRHVLTSGAGTDIFGGFPVVAPGGGSYSLKLGNNSTGAQAERARYYVHVPNNQNNYSLIYRYAVVFQNPTHTAIEQPRFEVTAYDSATNTIIPCADYSYVATANLPGFALSPLGSQVWYKDWTTASLDLSGQAGKTIAVDFAAGDCSQGGHFGYGYLDMNCALFQIVTVNCNGAPTTSLSAPPGFQTYEWWNSNFTTNVGSGQNIIIPTPAANTQFHLILTPYTGFGCPDTLTTTVNVTSLNVTSSNDTVICSGASIPLAVNATSSSNTINYSWAPASGLSCTNCQNPVVTPSVSSAYYVTVSDGNGCTETDTVHVALDDINLTTSSQPAGCSGANGGSATALPTAGYPPYSYSWSTTPVQTSSTANGLPVGTYTVTLTDAKGCTTTATETILQVSSPISVSITSLTQVSCQGAMDGSATLSATGGVGPYTFVWNTTPVQIGSTASGLAAGMYTVTVTDFQGCSSSQTVTITEPSILTATNTTSNLICPNGNNGSITAIVSGGTAPYTYSWNTTPVQTGATINNLSAGTYLATITDSHGCTTSTGATMTSTNTTVIASANVVSDVTCYGAFTGSASASATGGVSPYSYSWSPGPAQSTPFASNLSAGIYTVTVSDNNGCSGTASVTISQPSAPVTASVSGISHNLCFGGQTGTATALASGGTPPYSYSWNTVPVQNAAIANSLAAGNYLVTVTDAAGCSATVQATITQPATSISANGVNISNVTCFGGANGNASVVSTGGIPPYTYSWNTTPIQSTPTVTGLGYGSYIITVTDYNGCSDTANISISQPSPLSTSIAVNNLFCNGGTNGSATANVIGGTTPYSYTWNTNPIQSGNTATGLTSGTYTVTITDASGCSNTSSATIAMPSSSVSATISNVTSVLCYGSATGTATVTASGGTSPYNFYWNSAPFQSASTATNLLAGTYSVIVTDDNGCNDTTQVTISQPPPLSISISNVSNVTCHGGSDGTALVSVTGGIPPYSYNWSNSTAQTGPAAVNLLAGSYMVSVTDANGCIATVSINITEPQAVNASINSSINVLCNSWASGSANVSVTGGISPYSYIWNTIPAQMSPTATNLSAGSYVVTVSDVNGCTDTAGISITQPNSMLVSLSVSNPFCTGGTNGSATANVTGGTAPYTFTWNTIPTQTTATATSLAPGTYSVTISDANGCTSTASATIAMPSTSLNASIVSASPVLCYGSNNGSATAAVSGGTAPYSYFWNSSPFQVGASASGLSAGNYVVTVTDNNGCSDTAHVTITQPSAPLNTQTGAITHVTCHDGQNGNASTIVTGGIAPYSFNWGTNPSQTTSSAMSLAAGTYVVTVTDANGCTTSQSVTITQPTKVNATIISTTNVSCFSGSNGIVTVAASGGIFPYTYQWNTTPTQSTATASNLSAGQYTVTVTDVNGCTTTTAATITHPNVLNATTTVSNLFCAGGNNGSATAVVSGGAQPYSYSWSTTPLQTSASASNLSPGSYTVLITDALGCTTYATAMIALPSSPVIASIGSTVHVNCYGEPTGAASALTTGGTAPYSYIWNSTPFQTTATATNLLAGAYSVIVTDNNGCSDTANVTITQPQSAVSATISSVAHPLCHGTATGSASVGASGGSGPYTFSWNTSPIQTSSTAVSLTAGTYMVTVTDAAGCATTQSVTISQPDVLNATIGSITHVSCNGGNSGSATVSVSGGIPSYSYTWNSVPGQAAATAWGLMAGSYNVTVTDANGCMDTSIVSISQPTALSATITVTDISCASATGTASAAITGGIPPYSYTWNTTPVQTTATAVALAPGSYAVSISDAGGCSISATATIVAPQPGIIATIASHSNVNCFDGSDGSAFVSASGGAAPYNYAWNTNPVQTTASAIGLKAGTYNVMVTDNNGCYDTASVTIGQPNKINIVTQVLKKTCDGQSEGTAKVSANGGVAPYTIVWGTTPVQTDDTIEGLSNGVYVVTVTDATGCTQSAVVVMENYPAAAVSAGADQIVCEGESTRLYASGGVAYLWSPFSTLSCASCANPVASPANTTTYKVVGIDKNNCRDSDIVEVVVLHPQPMDVGPLKTICEGDSVSLFAAGGAQYTWYPSLGLDNSQSAAPVANPLLTTEYNVIIRQNQCYADTLQQQVIVLPRPTIELGPDHQGIAGSTLQINSQATHANTIDWTPATNLSCESCFNPIATLENSISYTATVRNELGCTAKDEINIRVVCDNSVFFIANTFTPNGDGQNDVFFPQGRGIKNINSFRVYNRWGEVMHEARNFSPNDPSYGWDGSFKGLKLNPDAFVYMVNGVCQNGDPVSIKGDVSLLR